MQSIKYVEGLKGWTGVPKKYLLEGKYRPCFVGYGIKQYHSQNKKKNIVNGKDWNKDYVRVKATKKNLQKIVAFNKDFGEKTYGERATKSYNRITAQR